MPLLVTFERICAACKFGALIDVTPMQGVECEHRSGIWGFDAISTQFCHFFLRIISNPNSLADKGFVLRE